MEKEAVAEIAGMFGWERRTWATSRRRHDGEPRGAVGRGAARTRDDRASPRRRRTTRTAASAPCSVCRSRAIPATAAAAWTSRRSRRARRAAASARSSRRWARRRPARSIRCRRSWRSRERHGFRVHADAAYGGYFGLADNLAPEARAAFDRVARGRLDRDRPAQARPAALRLRLRALPRSRGRPLLQARFALHVFHLAGAAPGRDQPRVLPPGRRRRRALGDAAAAAARARRRVRAELEDCRAAALELHAGWLRGPALRRRPSSPSSTSSSGRCAATRARGVLRARSRGVRRGGAARPAPRAGRAAGRRSSTSTRPASRATRIGHVPALGPDEARAPRWLDDIHRLLSASTDGTL